MFAVLTVKERRTCGLPGWLRLFSRPAPPSSRIVQEGSVSYLRIQAQTDKRHALDWDAVLRLAAWAPAGLLLPEGMVPPEGCAYRAADTLSLQRLLSCNACCRALQMADLPPSRLRVCLVDHSGRYGKAALTLLRYASTVKIYTRDPGLFERTARQSIKRYGAPLVVSDQPSCVSDCPVVLSPWGGPEATDPEAVVFSVKPMEGPHGLCFTGYSAAVGGDAGRLCPGGIEPIQFAAALYAAGRLRDPVEASACRAGGQWMDFLGAAAAIRRACDKINAKETVELKRKH